MGADRVSVGYRRSWVTIKGIRTGSSKRPSASVARSARPVWAEVDLDAIADNVGALRASLPPDTHLMAVVKADGYGHGAVQTARAALGAGAAWLGVALPEEGAELAKVGIESPILVLGAFAQEQADLIVASRLRATVAHVEAARSLSAAAERHHDTVRVHLKVDTGMGRLGVLSDDALDLARHVASLPGLEVEGVFTHLATAGEDRRFAAVQIERFNGVREALQRAGFSIPLYHVANSAGAVLLKEAAFDMVRTGIAIYGLLSASETPAWLSLRPAFSLKARVSSVKWVPKGFAVGYGATYETPSSTQIATLPIGYADGFRRGLTRKASVLIGGRRHPVVGRICMDQCMVDVGDHPVQVGDEAVLIGRQGDAAIGADEWADALDTISYEVVTGISARVPRRYVGAGGEDGE